MKTLLGLALLVFCAAVGSYAACCDNYAEIKEAINQCEEEIKSNKDKNISNEICYGLTCIANKWGVMENGKLNTEKEDGLFTKIFPESSSSLKSKLLECSAKANDQKEDCQVLVKTYNCVFDSAEHRREIDSLLQKREDEQPKQ